MVQPWAYLIVGRHEGQLYKDVENRTWRTDYRGPLYVHAPKEQWDMAGAVAAMNLRIPGFWYPGRCPTGAFVGLVYLDDVHLARPGCRCDKRWAEHDPRRRIYHWVLRDPLPFPEPVDGRGMPGLFNPPASLVERYPPDGSWHQSRNGDHRR